MNRWGKILLVSLLTWGMTSFATNNNLSIANRLTDPDLNNQLKVELLQFLLASKPKLPNHNILNALKTLSTSPSLVIQTNVTRLLIKYEVFLETYIPAAKTTASFYAQLDRVRTDLDSVFNHGLSGTSLEDSPRAIAFSQIILRKKVQAGEIFLLAIQSPSKIDRDAAFEFGIRKAPVGSEGRAASLAIVGLSYMKNQAFQDNLNEVQRNEFASDITGAILSRLEGSPSFGKAILGVMASSSQVLNAVISGAQCDASLMELEELYKLKGV